MNALSENSPPDYAELHCLSNFSFLRGASHPEELVLQAHALGYQALALTDECSLAGIVRAHVEARRLGLHLLVGSEFRFPWGEQGGLLPGFQLVLLATDRSAYGRLCALITQARRRAPKGCYRMLPEDLDEGAPGCLVLWYPDLLASPEDLLEQGLWLSDRFAGRLWLGCEEFATAGRAMRDSLRSELAAQCGIPLVCSNDVHMHRRGRRFLQDTLTAVRLGRTLAEAGYALFPNGERYLRPRARVVRIHGPERMATTVEIAALCRFRLDELRYEYPEELVPAGLTATQHLRALTEIGFARRCGGLAAMDPVRHARIRDQVEHELALIAELAYEPFFLTVHDIVRFARSRGILCQGRGSAANSVVCYCLDITEVDPARMEMLFERFLSRERQEPPDIDVDFEHQRREEVMQYVYATYGRDRAALAATVICYRPRSAVRDAGRALGFDAAQVERLSRCLAWWDGQEVATERLVEAGFDPAAPMLQRLSGVVAVLVGFPRHLSQHVGGFVISRGPLSELAPVENASMPGRTVLQWDKDDLEALGLLKVDCLALGMLSALRRALELVSGLLGRPFGLADIPAEDPAVYRMISRGDTIGVFQIESRAQTAMLPKMQPRTYYDLVIEVAIVRPGPIQGGMVHPYLRRRRGLEAVSYPSPAVRQVLERTLGVPIFQEQVMQLAIVAAGFSPGEADQLRRSMAAWKRKGGLDHFRRRIVDGMTRRGYEAAFAEQIFLQIQGFGEYGFPESHAASFALLVYASAWLKHHYPAAFTCALLNSLPMGFYSASQLVQDLQRHQVSVHPPRVRQSAWESTLEADGSLRLGLQRVQGFGVEPARRLLAARDQQAFRDVADLARRAGLNRAQLEALAAADTLSDLSGHRHAARWAVQALEEPLPLFAALPSDDAAVDEATDSERWLDGRAELPVPREGRDIVEDYRTLGLTLRRHPLALLRPRLRAQRLLSAAELQDLVDGQLARAAGIVTCRQRPGTASGVTFVTLEDETGLVNVVVWRDIADRQRRELLGSSLLAVYGVVQRDGPVLHLVARRLADRSAWLGSLQASSRDFH
jgi:error-prone DNA polymerase